MNLTFLHFPFVPSLPKTAEHVYMVGTILNSFYSFVVVYFLVMGGRGDTARLAHHHTTKRKRFLGRFLLVVALCVFVFVFVCIICVCWQARGSIEF